MAAIMASPCGGDIHYIAWQNVEASHRQSGGIKIIEYAGGIFFQHVYEQHPAGM